MPGRSGRWWVRFPDESLSCPACHTDDIRLLEALSISRKPDGRTVAFASGCQRCGLVFANPLPTPEQLAAYYSDTGEWAAPRIDRLERIERSYRRKAAKPRRDRPRTPKAAPPGGPERLFNAMAPYFSVDSPPAGAKVLDFGCGDGKLLNRLEERGWETYGIEPSTNVPFLRHRRLETPPQDASFDLVVLHHVLEHVLDPLDILRQLAGSVRVRGKVLISVPRLDTLPVHRDLNYCLDARRHIMTFTERCMTSLLARAGFGDVLRLDLPELDDTHTDGLPKRLRLIAARVAAALPPPASPLEPALTAFAQFSRHNPALRGPVERFLPVRIRAAIIERRREAEALARRGARLSAAARRGD